MTANHFNVDSLHDGIDFNTKLVRATFESLCSNLFSQVQWKFDLVIDALIFLIVGKGVKIVVFRD